MGLRFSSGVLHKLKVKHGVTSQEVEECFLNREPYLLTDYRECHKPNRPHFGLLLIRIQAGP